MDRETQLRLIPIGSLLILVLMVGSYFAFRIATHEDRIKYCDSIENAAPNGISTEDLEKYARMCT